MREICVGELGAAEVGPLCLHFAQVRLEHLGPDKAGFAEVGSHKERLSQIGTRQVGRAQVRTEEERLWRRGSLERNSCKVRILEVALRQRRTAQVAAREVGFD